MINILFAITCVIANPHDGHDGHGGFVWKPVGAHFNHNAVPVLPSKYKGTKAKLTVYATGKRIQSCRLKTSGVCPDSPECLNRPTYICPHSGKKYKELYGPITLRVDFQNHCRTWEILDPSRRID